MIRKLIYSSPQKILFVLLVAGLFSGCGFQLRKPVELPPDKNQIFIRGLPAGRPFVSHLKQTIKLSDGRVTQDLATAGLVLNVLNDQSNRREVSLSQTGQANEFELTYRLDYELQSPDGKIILPRQSIQVTREYFNPQVNVIGKNSEENVIRNEMYKEVARTLLSRIEMALRRTDVVAP